MRLIAIIEAGKGEVYYVNPASINFIADRKTYREVLIGGYRAVHTKQTYAELLEAIEAAEKPVLPPAPETPYWDEIHCALRYPSEEL